MQLISYRLRGSADQNWRAAVAHNGQVIDAAALLTGSASARETGATMKQLLASGPESLREVFARARAALDTGPGALKSLDAADVELGPPVPDPDKIICIGLNYADHASEAGLAQTDVPVFFAKFRNSLIGPTSPIHLPSPALSEQIDYEGELAVVMGARCASASESEALEYVAGYSIMNDVSARDLQMRTSQWIAGKALDTFAPMGPGIVPASAIPDPQALMLTTRVNGQVVQHASTATMIFSVAKIIAFLSSLMTLEPGDIIATGTPAGVGFKRTPPLYLRAGYVVEVEIDGIGQLRNTVISA
jgi:2-keto-4-pentenoate hydratase/2-oxohepta-3-ene-1,7-dioic acid hydratase in catechol pathway